MTIISSGRAELEQVVAITFTEKAAGELKVRLREEIEKALRDASILERERYALALEQLDRASVSTIHSFASSLLRERPVEAVVDPGFEQLDEMGSDLLFDDAWQQWKGNQLREALPILRRLLALERKLDREIKPIARRLFENRDIALSLEAAESNYNLAAIWNQLAGSVDELTELANNCVDTGDRGYLQIQQFRRLFELGNAGDSQDRECTLFLDLHINKNAGSKQNWVPSDSCTRQKEIFASLKQGIGEARSAIGADIALGILEWLKDFLHAVEAEKQARGVLDFQDLLLKARDLVRDHRDVRAYFQQKFRYFLVDEFQDTDPLQAELVLFLAEAEPKAARWSDVELLPGKLFLVGDPKQSIYRFRRADIQIYQQVKKILKKSGAALIISQNFRSSASVIQGVNQLFEGQMRGGRYQAEYVKLVEQPDRPEAGPGLVLLFPPESYAPGNMLAYRETEAEVIARFCRKATDEYQVWDRSEEKMRPAELRDVAVLFPVTTQISHYEEALGRAELPFRFDAGRQFYERRETRALISVLRAVANPEDSIAVVAALRSPFFGLSDEDLFLHHQARGNFNYLRRQPEGPERVTSSLEQLRAWHDHRRRSSLPSLVEKVLDDSHQLPFHLLITNGEQAVANLLRIVELARAYEAQTGASLRGLVRWLEEREASELAEAEAALIEEEDNVIQLLSVHASKGLEFPIVVLANFACNKNPHNNFFIDHAANRVSFVLGKKESPFRTPWHEGMQSSEVERASAEDLRLLYVATTRAKDYLAVPLLTPDRTENARFVTYLQSLHRVSAPEGIASSDGRMLIPAKALPTLGLADAPVKRNVGSGSPPKEATDKILAERANWKEELEKLGLCKPAPPEEAPAGDTEEWKQDRSSVLWRAGGKARLVGTVFHRIMQQIELEADPLLDRIIEQTAATEGIGEEADLLKKLVQDTLTHPLLERARKAKRVWRELPFAISHDGELQEGYIDLLFEEEDGLVLLDYKTDEVTPAALENKIESYRPQTDIYQYALEQLVGRPPKESWLLFVRSLTAKKLDVP